MCVGSDSQIEIDLWQDVRLIEYQQRLVDERRNVLAHYIKPLNGASAKRLQTADLLWSALHVNGARSLGIEAGRLAPGMLADFITVDLNHPSMAGALKDDLISQLVFGIKASAIKDVFVAGNAIIESGVHPLTDQIVADYRQFMSRT